MNKGKVILGLMLLFIGTSVFAGTGGAELDSWYTQISDALTGTWGKIIAAFFLGTAIIIFKSGGVVGGIFMVLLGLSIGSIPAIINSKYTVLAGDVATSPLLVELTRFLG